MFDGISCVFYCSDEPKVENPILGIQKVLDF